MHTKQMPRPKRDTTKSSYMMDVDLKAVIAETGYEDDRNETQQLHHLVRLGLLVRSEILGDLPDKIAAVAYPNRSEAE